MTDNTIKQMRKYETLEEYIPCALNRVLCTIDDWQNNKSGLRSIFNVHKERFTMPSLSIFLTGENIAVVFHNVGTKYDNNCNKNKEGKIEYHNHDFYEIIYVYQGEITNYLPDQVIHQTTQQIILMNPMVYHSLKLKDEDTILFNILIKKDFSFDIFNNTIIENSNLIHAFLDRSLGLSPLQPYLVFQNTPDIALVIHQLIQDYYDQKPYYQQIMYSELMKLWALFAQQRETDMQKETRKKQYPDKITQILSYLRKHYATTTLVETAEKFDLSTGYISRYIQKYTGMKYNEIITQLKMQNAAGYLLHTNFSLEKIIELVGYNDTNYFIKAFKKYYGISPGKYRSQHK